MKASKILLLSTSLLLATGVHSQVKQIAESSSTFDEETEGIPTIYTMDNGSTIYLHFFKKKILYKYYDPQHNLKVEKTLNGDDFGDKTPPYYSNKLVRVKDNLILITPATKEEQDRTTFNGKDGSFKRDRIKYYSKYQNIIGINNREGYAICSYWPDEKVWVSTYSSDNKLVSNQEYDNPSMQQGFGNKHPLFDDDNRQLCHLGGNNFAILSRIASFMDDKGSSFVLRCIINGKLTAKKLPFFQDLNVAGFMMQYNPVSKKLFIMATILNSKKQYKYGMAVVNPENLDDSKQMELTTDRANEAFKNGFKTADNFSGTVEDFMVHPDGQMTAWLSDREYEISNGAVDQLLFPGAKLSHLVVLQMDANGKETSSSIYPMYRRLFFEAAKPMSGRINREYGQELGKGYVYTLPIYVAANKKNYLFINDLKENPERIQAGKLPNSTKKVSDFNAYYAEIGDKSGGVLQVNPVIPSTGNSGSQALMQFNTYDYNPSTNTMATLKITNGRRSNMRVVWLEL
ncbi:MAG: hypothetical protein JO154_21035 [Chitinophaga sp.]|uniref:hypothetical protein n=1 Tax=Chitinophaga sp. TaxID=1869181 RepID=UPI0025C59A10|nr:hypothetical protein [Chitinophaga sp.]MBV8255100.1 hypothetical protein [Chitinophaga sp.]